MTGIAAAAQRLRDAERACKAIPLWLPPPLYRRRMDAAMREWTAANLALFDTQMAALAQLPGWGAS